ncbi:MAG: hypothetical protein IKM31_08730 [Oscillospiraceae bacterium]|nr:hypothetical protein [Oscillospiraceae bacterium]
MKIYITGSVGSGKSTLARRAAEKLEITATELDDVVYEREPVDRKRTPEERDAIFRGILTRESWVMEDAGRKCFFEAPEQADQVILLQPPAMVRDFRILRRWFRQRAGKEACGYRPDLKMLRSMFRWRRNFDTGRDGLKERLAPFGDKLLVLRSDKEVKQWLESLK